MEFVKVASTNELAPNQMKMVSVDGKEILLANVEGLYFAIANKCTHLGGSLSKGTLEGGVVTCPKHGAQFDVKTGQALAEAKLGFIKMKVKNEPSFTVRVEGTEVFVSLT
jgi:3-phenylpropionate/trans-cinnamate dioxygenase ferredoxin component